MTLLNPSCPPGAGSRPRCPRRCRAPAPRPCRSGPPASRSAHSPNRPRRARRRRRRRACRPAPRSGRTLGRADAATAGDDDAGEVSSGRSLSATLSSTHSKSRGSRRRADLLDRGGPARQAAASKDDVRIVTTLTWRQRISPSGSHCPRRSGARTCRHRPPGGVGDHHHVEQRRDARQHVLGVGRRGGHDVAVVARQDTIRPRWARPAVAQNP
jgi:hypothetical protein